MSLKSAPHYTLRSPVERHQGLPGPSSVKATFRIFGDDGYADEEVRSFGSHQELMDYAAHRAGYEHHHGRWMKVSWEEIWTCSGFMSYL